MLGFQTLEGRCKFKARRHIVVVFYQLTRRYPKTKVRIRWTTDANIFLWRRFGICKYKITNEAINVVISSKDMWLDLQIVSVTLGWSAKLFQRWSSVSSHSINPVWKGSISFNSIFSPLKATLITMLPCNDIGLLNDWLQLRNGTLVKVFPRLVLRSRTHFHTLPCGVDVVMGVNGYIWVSKHVPPSTVEANAEAIYSNKNDVSFIRTICPIIAIFLPTCVRSFLIIENNEPRARNDC